MAQIKYYANDKKYTTSPYLSGVGKLCKLKNILKNSNVLLTSEYVMIEKKFKIFHNKFNVNSVMVYTFNKNPIIIYKLSNGVGVRYKHNLYIHGSITRDNIKCYDNMRSGRGLSDLKFIRHNS